MYCLCLPAAVRRGLNRTHVPSSSSSTTSTPLVGTSWTSLSPSCIWRRYPLKKKRNMRNMIKHFRLYCIKHKRVIHSSCCQYYHKIFLNGTYFLYRGHLEILSLMTKGNFADSSTTVITVQSRNEKEKSLTHLLTVSSASFSPAK